jgi:DNA-binding CsgD family transcriptional regulator/DNA replicative helicase MCM subunit Mcm2 (Cdc46/Mcm family)
VPASDRVNPLEVGTNLGYTSWLRCLYDRSMLIGRSTECATIERLLADARHGRSNVLVLRGEPGVGKSALLRYASAQAHGFTVVATRGVESEAELAFAGLADVSRPLLHHLPGLPHVQADALKAALALGPPVGGDRFTIAAASLTLVGSAAERRPVLALVDDAHWLDAPSAEVIGFVARRLDAEGILLLLALRDSEPATLDTTGLPDLVIEGLEPAAAEALINRRTPSPVAGPVAARLTKTTSGNPLALLELPTLLSANQLAGIAPLPEPLPAGESIQRAFLRRVAPLPASVKTALLVAAASDNGDLSAIVGASGQLGAATALEAAEAAGLVVLSGSGVEFRHPLVRAAIYHSATPSARRAVHRALAAAFRQIGDADRHAWQLAAAAIATDQRAADALEQAGLRAQARGGYGVAGRAFERAARLSLVPEQRAHRLEAAAEALWYAGQLDQAIEVLDDAHPLATTPHERADLHHLRGRIETWRGNMPGASRLLIAEGEAIATINSEKAALMLADATFPLMGIGDCAGMLAITRRAQALAKGSRKAVQAYVSLSLGLALILSGKSAEGYPLVLQSRSDLEDEDPSLLSSATSQFGSQTSIWVEDWGQARRTLQAAISSARTRSAPRMFLPYTLGCLSELDYRAGRWDEAAAEATEAVRLARETGQRSVLSFDLICLARVNAVRGDEQACRGNISEALELAERYGIASTKVYAAWILALLELGSGRPTQALTHLELVADLLAPMGLGEPGTVQWAPDYIETNIRAGRVKQAFKALRSFQQQAEATQRTWALATAARCRGLLSNPRDAEPAFAESYQWHTQLSMPFELARTQLCHGRQLRRAKQRSLARECLRASLATFERLDAPRWVEQARAELLATGESARRRARPATRRLTPQEFQVARLVADGMSNRDIASALFLSHKTVEFHLAGIHRKFGTSSRAQLVRHLIQQPPSATSEEHTPIS